MEKHYFYSIRPIVFMSNFALMLNKLNIENFEREREG